MSKFYGTNGVVPKDKQTSKPSMYPQGYFKEKACRACSTTFKPTAPSELYCSDRCAERAKTTAYLMRNYNITLDDYEALLEEQGNVCAICGGEGFVMSRIKNNHVNKLVVDHCHTTGKVRGLLCHNCNRALGLLKDDAEILKNAISYLNV